MVRRFRLTSFVSVACLVLFLLVAQGRATGPLSVWDEICKSARAGIYTDDQPPLFAPLTEPLFFVSSQRVADGASRGDYQHPQSQ